MKRILFMLSAAVALLASCAKQNVSEPQIQGQDIKISFEVASRPDFESDTKAVKSDWLVGDEILIVFEGKDGWLDFSKNANTLKLKKTADDWIRTNLNFLHSLLWPAARDSLHFIIHKTTK